MKEDGKDRQLRRPLTGDERAALEIRRNELDHALAPHGNRDVNRIALALTDMYGGFPSMRVRDDGSLVGRIDSVRRVLAAFPAWAIEKACRDIQINGVWRDGKFDQQWPPSDAEIVVAVRQALQFYGDQHDSAIALLEAKVEEQQ